MKSRVACRVVLDASFIQNLYYGSGFFTFQAVRFTRWRTWGWSKSRAQALKDVVDFVCHRPYRTDEVILTTGSP